MYLKNRQGLLSCVTIRWLGFCFGGFWFFCWLVGFWVFWLIAVISFKIAFSQLMNFFEF